MKANRWGHGQTIKLKILKDSGARGSPGIRLRLFTSYQQPCGSRVVSTGNKRFLQTRIRDTSSQSTPSAAVWRQVGRFSSSVQSRLVRRAITHLSVHYRWWTLTAASIMRQRSQTERLRSSCPMSAPSTASTVCLHWCRRPARCGLTTTDTRCWPRQSGSLSMCMPMPTGSSSGRMG